MRVDRWWVLMDLDKKMWGVVVGNSNADGFNVNDNNYNVDDNGNDNVALAPVGTSVSFSSARRFPFRHMLSLVAAKWEG